MASFDWQTEEDGSWGDNLPNEAERSENQPRKWLPMVLVVLGIILVGGLLFWQIRGRIGGAEEVRNEDIVAAHNLLVYAADRQDPSVLLGILPVENQTWTGIQRSLVSRDLLLDRWPLGIRRNGEEPAIIETSLAPDFQSAEVTIEIPYHLQSQGRPETIRLRQTQHYQFRDEWYWTEPNDEYWGGADNDRYENGSLMALYPPRDETIVRRIVEDVPAYLEDLCNEPGLPDCGNILDILIHFEREPAILLDLASRTGENGSYISDFMPSSILSRRIMLPAPSLVGIPVDEAGYQALLRGYTSHILAAILTELYRDDCCPGDLSRILFLESEMAKRGLGFWPPHFLVQEFLPDNDPDFSLDKEIALLCTTGEWERLQLYRYDLGDGRLHTELRDRNIVRIRSAPNGQGIIAQEIENISDDEVLTRLIYWYDSTARILYEETLPETVFAALSWQVHEEEERLLMVVPDLDNRVTTFTRVDLSGCAAGNCPVTTQEMTGAPTWSPDSSQFLIKDGNILWWRQFVGDKINQEPLGMGTAPFWVDDDTFGFVRTGENRFQEIVTADPGDDEPTVVLDSERLRRILSQTTIPNQLMIGYVGLNPVLEPGDLPDWAILGFEWFPNGELGRAYVFSYDPEVDALTVLLQSDNLHSFNLSPNGRWLASSLYDESLASWRIKIDPIKEGQDGFVIPWGANDGPLRYDWTADSQWLLILHQGMITLYSPESQTYHIAPPPIPGCVQAAWMN